ncbi:transglutaminase domain-containing protein [Chloroflexota bacterium]
MISNRSMGKLVKGNKVLLSLILVLIAGLTATNYASATPSTSFQEKKGEVFDDWEICRTRGFGEDGFYQFSRTSFRPVIAFESLGEEAALAYRLGEQIASKYPDQLQTAEEIFYFVRDRVKYTSDIDTFKHEEYAQNADELATTIEQNGIGYGDCEDSTVLLAVMYKGAGFRSAIVTGREHTAALVYLPDYKKAKAIYKLEDEPGWVWAEATGKNNPLGWVPKEFIGTKLIAYEIGEETVAQPKPSTAPSTAVASTGGGSSSQPFPFIGVFALLWFMSLFRRRRA